MKPPHHFSQFKRFEWSEATWIVGFIRAVNNLSNMPQDFPHDCWFSSPDYVITSGPVVVERYPKRLVKLKDSRVEKRNQSVPIHIFAAALMFPQRAFELGRDLLVRHRCVSHATQLCWNPWHLRLGTHQENMSDIGCKNGSALWCPHSPACLWNDAQGKHIRCRNLRDAMSSNCTCNPKCKELQGTPRNHHVVPINKVII